MGDISGGVATTSIEHSGLDHAYGLCERTAAGFLAEPLNALTSFLFLFVGLALVRFYRKQPKLHGKIIWDVQLLLGLVFCIGAASLTFHTMPGEYTELADIAFIVIFINVYFFSAMFRIAHCNWFQTIVCYLAYAGSTYMLVHQFPHAFNDSIGYLSSMTALIMIALYLNMKRRPSSRMFLLAALTGVISLFLRSVDNAVCGILPTGTHFLWHGCNALLVYLLMQQLIRNVNRRERLLQMANSHFA